MNYIKKFEGFSENAIEVEFNELLGKTFVDIVEKSNTGGDDKIIFTSSDGYTYTMYHEQDCCESVEIDDINGDLNDLLNNPILLAEESTNYNKPRSSNDEESLWTFYKLGTVKGYVNIKWYGTSNGYYSMGVTIVKSKK